MFFWQEILIVVLKTSLMYWLMIFGLRLIGRRAIGQLGPHEFILIALLAKIMGDQIVTKETGIWGNIAGFFTLFFYAGLIDQIPALRNFVQGPPIRLMHRGHIDDVALKKQHLSQVDLDRTARDYGFDTYQVFDDIVLERDGKITGVLKPEFEKTQGSTRSDKRKQF
jgi:uncharacterized membrane protein YcaP (DUF421 family)